MKKILALLLLFTLCVTLIACKSESDNESRAENKKSSDNESRAENKKSDDPFENIHLYMSKSEVEEKLGLEEGNSATELLGKKVYMRTVYDDANLLTRAFVTYGVNSREEVDEEEISKYMANIIELYTEKYGSPTRNQYGQYIWTIDEGSGIVVESGYTYIDKLVTVYLCERDW